MPYESDQPINTSAARIKELEQLVKYYNTLWKTTEAAFFKSKRAYQETYEQGKDALDREDLLRKLLAKEIILADTLAEALKHARNYRIDSIIDKALEDYQKQRNVNV